MILGGTLPFRTRGVDEKTDLLLEEARQQTMAKISVFLRTARFAAPGHVAPVPQVGGDNLHRGAKVALRCPASLHFLAGHGRGAGLGDLQSALIALSFLEKRHRRRDLMASWGLVLAEQHCGVADSFMGDQLAGLPAAAGAPVFTDTLQSRTAQGMAFIRLLVRYDELCAAAGGAAGGESRAAVEAATFCLHEAMHSAVRYRKVVQKMEKQFRFPSGRIHEEKYREFCHQMVHGSRRIPLEIAGRVFRPWRSDFETWGAETLRNRQIIANVKAWLANLDRAEDIAA